MGTKSSGKKMNKQLILIPVVYFFCSIILGLFLDKLLIHLINSPDAYINNFIFKSIILSFITSVFIYLLIKKWIVEKHVSEKQQECLLSLIINSIPDFVNLKDKDGRWLFANHAAIQTFQMEADVYKGKTDVELEPYCALSYDELLHCERTDEQTWLNRAETRFEEVFAKKGGGTTDFDVIKIPMFHDNGERKFLLVISRDITRLKQAKLELSESEKRYQRLVEFFPDMILVHSNDTCIFVNKAGVRLLGGENHDEILTTSLCNLVKTDYSANITQNLDVYSSEKETVTFKKGKLIRFDGNTLDVECIEIPIIFNKEKVKMSVFRDMTIRNHAEEVIQKAHTLNIIGELAAGVAHEIRNPLTSLKGFTQLLQRSVNESKEYAQIMMDELNRIEDITTEFLMLAKPQKINYQKENLTSIINRAMTLMNPHAILKNTEIELDCEYNVLNIQCEANHLNQVFINILKNAIDSMEGKGKVTIRVKKGARENVIVSFIDQGCGIPQEKISNLGQPFYTTKEKGTGLGLMVSYNIIKNHQGDIRVESEVGKGTTFHISLPLFRNHNPSI
ncbi:Sporulation kinase E [compost metagenome]